MNYSFEIMPGFSEQAEFVPETFSAYSGVDYLQNFSLADVQNFSYYENNFTPEANMNWQYDMPETFTAPEAYTGNFQLSQLDHATLSEAGTSPFDLTTSNSPQQTSLPSTPYSAPDHVSLSLSAPPMRRAASGHEKVAQRSRRALQESIARANRQRLKSSPATSPSPSTDQAGIGPSSKVSKGRKRDEKKKCELCEIELSGDHEFIRHFNLIHEPEGWRWQVIDPAEKGLTPRWRIPLEISECKNCQMHKLYGINYNAAAHIRRVHFKSAPKNGSKGGSSGGAWPEIRYLEYLYMKLVHIKQISSTTKKPKEGVDYVRTGREQATILREPHSKRHSSVPASNLSDAEGQASHCQSFMVQPPEMDVSAPHDEFPPHAAASTWPSDTFFAQSTDIHLNSASSASYDETE